MVSRLECTRVHFVQLGLGLETWSPRSRSWSRDLKTQVDFGLGLKTACLVPIYACSTITVICSTFKRVLCHQLELMQPVMWSQDHGLETQVHSSSFCPVEHSDSRFALRIDSNLFVLYKKKSAFRFTLNFRVLYRITFFSAITIYMLS